MIYADENVWYPVVEGLRRRGWTVTTARDVGDLVREIDRVLQRTNDRDRSNQVFFA